MATPATSERNSSSRQAPGVDRAAARLTESRAGPMVGWQSQAPGSHFGSEARDGSDPSPWLEHPSLRLRRTSSSAATATSTSIRRPPARTATSPPTAACWPSSAQGIRGTDDRLAVRPGSVALAEAVTAWSAGPRCGRPRRRARWRPRRQRAGGMKRRKVTYPVARTHTKGAPRAGAGPEVVMVRPNLVSIDITAGRRAREPRRRRPCPDQRHRPLCRRGGHHRAARRRRDPGGQRPDRCGRDAPGPDDRSRPDRRSPAGPTTMSTRPTRPGRRCSARPISTASRRSSWTRDC